MSAACRSLVPTQPQQNPEAIDIKAVMSSMAGGSMMGQRIDITPRSLATEDIPDVVGRSGLSLADLHRYVYSLPVSSLCSGCDTVERLEHNVGVLRNLRTLSEGEMERLGGRAAPYAGFNVENYKRVLG